MSGRGSRLSCSSRTSRRDVLPEEKVVVAAGAVVVVVVVVVVIIIIIIVVAAAAAAVAVVAVAVASDSRHPDDAKTNFNMLVQKLRSRIVLSGFL